MGKARKADFNVLPEGCIMDILLLSIQSPRDAIRLSLVSLMLRSAAESDIVWEKFLPADYEEIISRSVSSSSSSLVFNSKKELYLRLCDHPILIDGGNKSFALEKQSGKKCYMIGARELVIIWGDTPEYWRWRSLPESRFAEVAELLAVCWLEIHGKIETQILSPKTTYASYLVLKFAEGARGFDYRPAEVSVRLVTNGDDSGATRYVYLMASEGSSRRRQQQPVSQRYIQRFRSTPFLLDRGDGWMEIELGEFFNDKGDDGEVQMSLLEERGWNWKRGLIIQGIEIRPKERK